MHMVFGLQSHDNRTQRDKGAKGQRKKREKKKREGEGEGNKQNKITIKQNSLRLCSFAPLRANAYLCTSIK